MINVRFIDCSEIQVPKTLKEQFIEIGNSFLQEQMSKHVIEEMNYVYRNLFLIHNLEELQYKLEFNDQKNAVQFTPIREIDRLAIEGIMAMPDRVPYLTRHVIIEKIYN